MYEKFFKHPLDFVLALISFILLFPLLLVLTVLGAIKMKGNPFFAQPRPGKNERIFKLIKFFDLVPQIASRVKIPYVAVFLGHFREKYLKIGIEILLRT